MLSCIIKNAWQNYLLLTRSQYVYLYTVIVPGPRRSPISLVPRLFPRISLCTELEILRGQRSNEVLDYGRLLAFLPSEVIWVSPCTNPAILDGLVYVWIRGAVTTGKYPWLVLVLSPNT